MDTFNELFSGDVIRPTSDAHGCARGVRRGVPGL